MLESALLERIVGKESIWCIFSQATRHPFFYCHPESCEDQIFLFSSEAELKAYGEVFLKEKNPLMPVSIKGEEKRKFFIDNRMRGVSEIVYFLDGQEGTCLLEDLLAHPDLLKQSGWRPLPEWDKMPADKRPLLNPGLQTTALYFTQELNRQVPRSEKEAAIQELAEELEVNLVRSRYLLPALILPGKKGEKERIQYVTMTDKEGKVWLPLLSDIMEFTAINRENQYRGLTIELKGLLPNLPENIHGVLLNPNSIAMQLPLNLLKPMVEHS